MVSATDGAQPQTREHILLAKQTGVEHIVVYINKVDIVDKDIVDLVELEIRDLLTQMGYNGDDVPVVRGSARCALEEKNRKIGAESIDRLLAAIDKFIPSPARDPDAPFVLPIEHVYHEASRGTVVTGCLEQGRLKKGVDCEIFGYGKTIRTSVASIEIYSKTTDHGEAGDQMGAMVRGIKRGDVRRGMVMSRPRMFKLRDHIGALVYVLTQDEGGRSKPLAPFSTLTLFSKTWNRSAQVNIPEGAIVMPGEHSK